MGAVDGANMGRGRDGGHIIGPIFRTGTRPARKIHWAFISHFVRFIGREVRLQGGRDLISVETRHGFVLLRFGVFLGCLVLLDPTLFSECPEAWSSQDMYNDENTYFGISEVIEV